MFSPALQPHLNTNLTGHGDKYLTTILRSGMGSKSIAHEAGGRHLFPSATLTFSSQWLSQGISLFLHDISLSLEISDHKSLNLFNFKGKKFKMARIGFDLGASPLQCITLTPTPPRIC